MCGISGILKLDPGRTVNEDCLRTMRDSLYHRGPDDAGLVIDGPAGLAHRRLSIIDLGGGHQPMANAQRTIWLTYNGEIYNFRELRTRLVSMGCTFVTDSDTEVVLQAYEVFGENCIDHFRGMFAFAVWDARRQKLFLARDRLGIKPLYYAITDDQLLFASEIKAILAATSGSPAFNRSVLPEFLATRYVSGEETFFTGIRKLLPGHTLSWSRDDGLRTGRYWSPPLPGDTAGQPEKVPAGERTERVRAGLQDAVRSHLVSDVPVGLFLSGGIDSSALAALMAPLAEGPLHSFSVGFEEARANELHYARIAARAAGTCHHEALVTPEKFFALLPFLIWHEDEPIAFTSSIPLFVISRLAREHVKVVLTGEGADELFMGYDYRYRVTALNRRLGQRYASIVPEGARKSLAGFIRALPARLRRYPERTFLALGMSPRELFFENFSVFRRELRQSVLSDGQRGSRQDPFSFALAHFDAAGTEMLQCMSYTDMHTYLVELLMKQDQMSMAASLETRVPFLDHPLVEQVSAIPGPEKLRGMKTKALLRDAVKGLVPDAILKRPKMGFPVPIGEWLRGKFRPVVDEFVLGHRARARQFFDPGILKRLVREHNSGKVDHAERLWLLINFEIWQRIFIDGEHPESIYQDNRHVRHITSPDVGQIEPALTV